MRLYETYLAIGLIISGLAAVFVWMDAESNNDENAPYWALGTFLLLIIVAPIYLYHRAYGNKRSTSSYTPNAGFYMQCPKCHSTKISSMPTGYPTHYQGFTYRHQCLDCGNVWGT